MIRFFSEDSTQAAIERVAVADRPTLFVGAGASKEVGLPRWAELIDRLALRATQDLGDHQASVVEFLQNSGLLAAAERIERMLSDADMAAEIRKGIYQSDEPASVLPGPLSIAIAELRVACPGVGLVTTNYDQLLVQAIRQIGGDAHSYCINSSKTDAVIHLHGVVGFEEPEDGTNKIVLTEHDFLAPASGGWRRDAVSSALASGPCLFLGASLSDLNLLTPLHQEVNRAHKHVLLFVREPGLDAIDRDKREEIDRARWRALNVEVLFADNYGDLAQFVEEVRLFRMAPAAYVPLVRRAQEWRDTCLMPLMPEDPTGFRELQDALSSDLSTFLAAVQQDHGLEAEVMQLGLFVRGVGDDGASDFASIIATSDRIMLDYRSNERLALERRSPWSVVRREVHLLGRPVS